MVRLQLPAGAPIYVPVTLARISTARRLKPEGFAGASPVGDTILASQPCVEVVTGASPAPPAFLEG